MTEGVHRSWRIPRALSSEALRLLTTLPMDEIERRLLAPMAADGEVAELVALLRHEAAEDEECDHTHWLTHFDMRRAADLLERQAAAAPVARLPEDAQVIEPANGSILVPVPSPIPVDERLPEDQLCWWFESDEDCGYGSNWTLLRIRGSATGYTHWLPANALPLPEVNDD